MSASMKEARKLVSKTIADLRCSLSNVHSPEVLQQALELIKKQGSGYGSGKTATKMIEASLKKLTKAGKP
jgi:hypothetical protein